MSTPHPADIVPFGKYKGRPVVDLIADRSYTDWLAAQPWFRERYGNVYNLIVNTGTEPQDTPEHNKMQARFLDHDLCLSLVRRWLRDSDEMRAEWDKSFAHRLTERQRANLRVDPSSSVIESVQFEASGWDLHIASRTTLPVVELFPTACECRCTVDRCGADSEDLTVRSSCFTRWQPRRRERHCAPDCPATWSEPFATYGEALRGVDVIDTMRNSLREVGRFAVAVELKPVLGDDYPSVLRTTVKRAESSWARGLRFDRVAVLADAVQFEGVDLAAVRKIFRSQRVHLLTAAELPAPSPAWRCTCEDCAAP